MHNLHLSKYTYKLCMQILSILLTVNVYHFIRHKDSQPQDKKLDIPVRKFLTPTRLSLNSLTGISISYMESPDR